MIIAFTGKKGSGKTTASRYLETKYLGKRVNFKDAMIAEMKRNFPDHLEEIRQVISNLKDRPVSLDYLFTEKPALMRTLMQNYGTEVRRLDDSEYWTRQWKAMATGPLILTDDCRFLNEAAAVRDLGGVIIRINRVGLVSEDTHASEQEMDMIAPDIYINATDIYSLYEQLDMLPIVNGIIPQADKPAEIPSDE